MNYLADSREKWAQNKYVILSGLSQSTKIECVLSALLHDGRKCAFSYMFEISTG